MTLKVKVNTGTLEAKKGTKIGTAPLNIPQPGDEGYCDNFMSKLSAGQKACLLVTSISGGTFGTEPPENHLIFSGGEL